MNRHLFTPDFKDQPYWWDKTPRPDLSDNTLPADIDVAIIGSGYTGLCAGIQTARGGRSTVILDAQDAGWGCSTRNGGQISTSLKPDYEELSAKYGTDHAFRIVKEGHNALAWIGDFIGRENIDCNFKHAGRFHAAHNAKQYEKLAQQLAKQPKGLEVDAFMVPQSEQREELGSDMYHGGTVFSQHASLDPACYHQGLLERSVQAGATVIAHCEVSAIERESNRFRLTTSRGKLSARDVIVASNGYTGRVSPWLRRRVIPIGSYIIATEALDDALMMQLIPKDRVISDTRKLVYYYRASPDRTRIVFGGRVSLKETDARASAPRLHAEMSRIFPQLTNTKISHSWLGFVAYTFDTMPHLGKHDGIYYAMGYCGSGVSLASYFGTRIGQQVLGLDEGQTALDNIRFQTRPLYRGNPWFLAPSIRYYQWVDQSGR